MKAVRIGEVKGYWIGGTLFRRKRDLVAAIQAVLHAYEAGAAVSAEHFDFLLDLLSHHRKAEETMGSGIVAFEVRPIPGYEHVSGFWAIRSDGTEIPWSYLNILNPPQPFTRFRKVCRAAVADQLLDFKAQWFREHARRGQFYCAVTGDLVAAERAHVDHEPPLTLDALVRAFVADRGIDVGKLSFPKTKGTGIGHEFADVSLAEDWQAYHRRHAKLRVISDTANLSTVRRLCQ